MGIEPRQGGNLKAAQYRDASSFRSNIENHDKGGTNLLQRLFSKEYVTVDRVPEQYKERYILTAYRQPYSSVLDCLVSAIRLNNETINIWTHFIPFLAFLVYFYKTFPSKLWPVSAIQPEFYPLLAEEASICAFLLSSSVAHTFNCMTPCIRHTCFYLDYAAISMYGIGGASATYYYLRPLNSGFFLFESPNLFTGIAALCSLLVVYVTCTSRHNWQRVKYVVRTLAFMASFLYGNSPTFYRFLECGLTGEECTSGLIYLFIGWSTYLIAAILNATRVPEKYYARTFDIYGHNHQWVHIITAIGTLAHFLAIRCDMEERKDIMGVLLDGITFNSSLGWAFGTLAVSCVMALWFGSRLTSSGELRSKLKQY